MVAETGARAEVLDRLEALIMQTGRLFATHAQGALTPTQSIVLRHLTERGAVPMGELADALDITMAGATGLVDRMVQAGFLSRRRSEVDRRLVLVAATAEGRRVLDADRQNRFQTFRKVTEGLSLEDLTQFERILALLLDRSRHEEEA
jgi:DNA-binding MarR family transcriptional regulator